MASRRPAPVEEADTELSESLGWLGVLSGVCEALTEAGERLDRVNEETSVVLSSRG